MAWPWVSRERLSEAVSIRDSRIEKLEKQVEDLTAERKRLADFIAVRSNNLSIYGEIKPITEEDEPEPDDKESSDTVVVPPSRARAAAKQREARNLEKFNREASEADRLMADVIEAGKKAAEAQSEPK